MNNPRVNRRDTCRACGSKDLRELVDFGLQPVCGRFLSTPAEPEDLYPLVQAQCGACGLIQHPIEMPVAAMVPRYPWVIYEEAEGHLDRLVEEIIGCMEMAPDARIIALSYKDRSTLERLRGRGCFPFMTQLDLARDFGITRPNATIETLQSVLTRQTAMPIAAKMGAANLVVARHILEHAQNLPDFTEGIRTLVKPGGYVLFEVPDFSPALETMDYCTAWEEHASYFTPDTFRWTLDRFGFDVKAFFSYPYQHENSLCAIAQVRPGRPSPKLPGPFVPAELEKGRRFAAAFPERSTRIGQYLVDFKKNEGPIAMFGAGHLACKFINVFHLKSCFEFVVDDHPEKKGKYMAGSKLPIVGSESLTQRRIKLCLLSLSRESEQKVVTKYEDYLRQGGRFASIFPSSPRHLEVLG